MLTVRLTHPSWDGDKVVTWDASKTCPRDAQLCYEEMGITVEILSYNP